MKALSRWSWVLVLAVLVAVFVWFIGRHNLEADIRRDFSASGGKLVDLPKSVPFPWDRVCVAAPYATPAATSAMLGFDWNSDAHSQVRNDGVVLLMFATDTMVVGAADFSRELMPWAGKCYLREDARFQIL